MQAKLKIRKDDEVVVIAGKDKGKQGKVIRVLPNDARVVVQGVNMVKRHQKASMAGAAGIVEKEASLHVSNVSLLDPKDKKATKAGFKTLKDGKKVRISRRSGEEV